MARPLRLQFPGAIYHITARGNARQNIFHNNHDQKIFLSILAEVIKRFGFLCHAYCLMDNHYHLLIETPEANLSLGMRQLNGVYTQHFNRHHKKVGHLFQGRFKAIIIDRDSYLLELCRYVVLNPVRAGMVKHPKQYNWSSYNACATSSKVPEWLQVDSVLSQFSNRKVIARKQYAAFINDAIKNKKPSPWLELKGQIVLGRESFVNKILPALQEKKKFTEIPKAQRLLHRPSLKELFTPKIRKDKRLRDAAIRKGYLDYGYSMIKLADASGIHYTTVSKVIAGRR